MSVRRLPLISTIFGLLALSACGPSRLNSGPTLPKGSTGYFDKDGVDYLTNNDPRVLEAINKGNSQTPPPFANQSSQQEPPKPAHQTTSTTTDSDSLLANIKEIELTRFNSDSKNVARLGRDRVIIKVFFRNGEPVEFNAKLRAKTPGFSLSATAAGYSLSGDIDDGPIQTLGLLKFGNAREGVDLYYRAYKAKLKVRQDRSNPAKPGSGFDQQVKELSEGTYGWVHNWVVIQGKRGGPSFYIVDIVNTHKQNSRSVFAFKGDSKRTDKVDIPTVTIREQTHSSVRLVGNSESTAQRAFQVTLEDQQSHETNEIMLDVIPEKPLEKDERLPKIEQVIEFGPDGELVESGPAVDSNFEGDSREQEPPVHVEPARPGETPYLIANESTPRVKRMQTDFNRNRNSPGVKAAISLYQNKLRDGLARFYKYANPFRTLIETVGESYDVSPAFAYLTVVESAYFTGGKYVIQKAPSSSALGPFQFLTGTGRNMGLRVGGSTDERRYFAPSACAAARYVGKIVDMFDDSDTTVSILGYYQGEGGAGAAIYCSFDSSVHDRQACVKKISTGGYNGRDYDRFIRLAKSYNYTFAEMDRLAAIPKSMRDYVNKKLAVYFISNSMSQFGFGVDAEAPRSFPSNGTVFPPTQIQSEKCRQTVSALAQPTS